MPPCPVDSNRCRSTSTPTGGSCCDLSCNILLDEREAPAVLALAAPPAAAPALEADQALVHGLALPLVVDPEAVVILVQVDRRVVAGLARVAAVRVKRGDGGAGRDVRVTVDLGAFLPCVGSRHTRRGLDEVHAVTFTDHAALEGLGPGCDVRAIPARHGARLRGGAGRSQSEDGDAADARKSRLPSRPVGGNSGCGFHAVASLRNTAERPIVRQQSIKFVPRNCYGLPY